MKKRLISCFLVIVLTLMFTLPVMAADVVIAEPVVAVEDGIEFTPFTEMTQIVWRNYQGQLQFRVWSITNGRWLTDWVNFG